MRRLTLSLAGIAALAIVSTAGAVPVSSQQCAPTGDIRTISIDPGLACIAKGDGNNVNDSAFQTAVAGWSWIGTEEEGVNASKFNVSLGQVSGQLTFNQDLWSIYDEIMVVLKVGVARGQQLDPDWALFTLASDFNTYSWSITPSQGGALSHASLYGRLTAVPEPATLGLLGLGLIGIAAARRRRR